MKEDQVSLVRYFADVSKLVTICYKLSLEKQDLLKKTQYHQESQSQNQQKIPMMMELSEQFSNKSKYNQQDLESQQKNQDEKLNLTKTRSGKHFYKRLILKTSKKDLQEKETFDCQKCDKKYFHKKSLIRHIKWNHQIIKLTNSKKKK
ncbi:unnamed protein product [Paramecium sonneborni]|uniref:C2H2-type domain-containing protein n=1 Tax=Paramecium sonneborni TaxID=65129 RepID=A0A8S1LN26_9CILI|nr:unnamed protein product [Paramecium sonneborni]